MPEKRLKGKFKYTNNIDWRVELAEFLITGGQAGRSQSEVSGRFGGRLDATLLNNELEALHLQDKVQRFDVPPQAKGGGKIRIVWRATTKILES